MRWMLQADYVSNPSNWYKPLPRPPSGGLFYLQADPDRTPVLSLALGSERVIDRTSRLSPSRPSLPAEEHQVAMAEWKFSQGPPRAEAVVRAESS